MESIVVANWVQHQDYVNAGGHRIQVGPLHMSISPKRSLSNEIPSFAILFYMMTWTILASLRTSLLGRHDGAAR